MSDWRVLIVEDDDKVASIHQRIVDAQPGFVVIARAPSVEDAMNVFRGGERVDLLLLDINLPRASGTALLHALRRAEQLGHPGPEVIAVTSCREPETLRKLVHLGVLDYLVKPFAVERLLAGLQRFASRANALYNHGTVEQWQADLIHTRPQSDLLPKNLLAETLDTVQLVLRQAPGAASAEDVAREAAVARVTARRYLEYLVGARQAEVELRHDGRGRPRKLYRLVSSA